MMIERGEQLSELADALDAARGRAGGTVLLTGSVGSGKTELLTALAGHAASVDAVTVRASCSASERSIPLGVIHQLSCDVLPDGDRAARLRRLLSRARTHLDALPVSWPGVVSPPLANILIDVWEHLRELSEQSPLVVEVDDVQHIDAASLHCLIFCARRISSTRMLLVLTDNGESQQLSTAVQAEVAHLPRYRSLRLPPLTVGGTAQVLAEHLSEPVPPRLAEACRGATGGNPALVHAMAMDCANTPVDPPDEPVAGAAFRSAVRAGVRRCGDITVQVACLLAVLGDLATGQMLCAALDMDPVTIQQALACLEAMGVVTAGRMAHPTARFAVREGLGWELRARLHRQAAVLLHDAGGPASVVAEHVLLADHVEKPWVGDVLEKAAGSALDAGDHRRAIEFLDLAERRCTTKEQQYTISARIALIERQHDPGSAVRRLPALVDAHRLGHLDGRSVLEVVDALMWDGQFETASEFLKGMTVAGTRHDPDTLSWLHVTRHRAHHTFPVLRSSFDEVPQTEFRHMSAAEQAASALTRVLTRDGETEAADQAELLLAAPASDDYTTSAIKMAVVALVYAGRTEKARRWCDRYLNDWMPNAPAAWIGALSAIRADIALREGDLGRAEKHARDALDLVDFDAWGVGLADPLGKLILATTWSGDLRTATHLVSRRVAPEAFRTRFGLIYIHAQVHLDLALRQPEIALRKALACGRLMQDWNLDHPSLVPWRTDAAEAYLQLGDLDRAKRLAQEQLRVTDGEDARPKGIALRVVSSTIEPSSRLPVLSRAAELLRACGDRLELARVLAEMGTARGALRDIERARADLTEARRLASECGSRSLVQTLEPLIESDAVLASPKRKTPVSGNSPRTPAGTSTGLASLTRAELRVAELAAAGRSNREISTDLQISVSTVEQHLTKVFRKLRITQRTDLWTFFHVDPLR